MPFRLRVLTYASCRFPSPEAYSLFVSPPGPLKEKTERERAKKRKTEAKEDQEAEPPEEEEEEEDTATKLKVDLDEVSSSLASIFNGLFSAKISLLENNESLASGLEVRSKALGKKSQDFQSHSDGGEGEENGMDSEHQEGENGERNEETNPRWEEFIRLEVLFS